MMPAITSMLSIRPLLLAFSLVLLVIHGSGCSKFSLKSLGKSDTDLVADNHISQQRQHLTELTKKLYKRNPDELNKAPGMTVAKRIKQLSDSPLYNFDEIFHYKANAAIDLAFSPNFTGDRVFALMVGINSMLAYSYNYKDELFMTDTLDEQKLYNSARNLEIVFWRLKHVTTENGEPIVITNSTDDDAINLSFERLFGKMISLQDMMAEVTADKYNRVITKAFHSVAKAALLPVGI